MRRILHASDLHFGPHYRPDVGEGLLRLIESRQPDLVVISGDLTQRAKRRQFRDARAWVSRLTVPWIAVPGNHDVPMYRAAFTERLLAPFGMYRNEFASELEPVVEDDSTIVIGVNTSFNWTIKDGRFTVAALERLDRLLCGARDKTKIVVVHHHLVPPPRFGTARVTARSIEALELMAHHGVEMVLAGHLHQTYVALSEEYYPTGRTPVLLIHAGTSTSSRGRGWERRRHTCNWIELGDQTTWIEHLVWKPRAEAFKAWRRQCFPRAHCSPWTLPAAEGTID